MKTAWSKTRKDIVEFAKAMDQVSKKTAHNYLKAYEDYMSGIRRKRNVKRGRKFSNGSRIPNVC